MNGIGMGLGALALCGALAGTAAAETCVTGGHYVIAAVKADFDLAVQLMVQDDLVALQRLVDSGRVGLLRAGIAVQVMETSG